MYDVFVLSHNRTNRAMPLDARIQYYDLTFVFSGELHYWVDGVPYTLRVGDGIFIPPGSYRVRESREAAVHYFSINFLTDGEPLVELPVYLPDCLHVVLKEQLLLFAQARKERVSAYAGEKQSLMLQLVLTMVRERMDMQSQNPYVLAVLRYVQTHFTQNITLADVAQSVHLTVPYCCALIKQELGTTIHQLIVEERLRLAKEYLLRGEVPLGELPDLCGFQSYQHFSKCFKKQLGVPPSRYWTGNQNVIELF